MPDNLFFVVARSGMMNIRERPSLSGKVVGKLTYGDQINLDTSNPADPVEAEAWLWRKYQDTWVAERTLDNSVANLLTVPCFHTLFETLPVDISQLSHFYYYGNTLFAYCCGRQNNYDGYSQALHGGLDFGHGGGLEICAGVTGTYRSTSQQFFGPNCIRVETPDGYTIMYGHVAHPTTTIRPGDPVTPTTRLAEIDSGREHLHLEVRYKRETHIVNPLLLMPELLSQMIIGGFPETGIFRFYEDANWKRWLTPFDQPIILRGSTRLLGPTAGKTDAELINSPVCHGMNC